MKPDNFVAICIVLFGTINSIMVSLLSFNVKALNVLLISTLLLNVVSTKRANDLPSAAIHPPLSSAILYENRLLYQYI